MPNTRRAERVNAARIKLRNYHRLGQRTNEQFPGEKFPRGMIEYWAQQNNVGVDDVRKARLFAEIFEEQEIDSLLMDADWPVSWSHMRMLLSIRLKAERLAWINRIKQKA